MQHKSGDLQNLIKIIYQTVLKYSAESFLVGGFVRDLLLNRETRDIDIAINMNPVKIAKDLANILNGKFVLLDRKNNICRVVKKIGKENVYIDLTGFHHDIKTDLSRRDFTINAIAIRLNDFLNKDLILIDPFNGEYDIKNRYIRAIGRHVFKKDPSRLLRAIKFCTLLNFNIETETEELILNNKYLAKKIPGEKIREDLLSILGTEHAYNALRYMDRLGLLSTILPEIDHMRDVAQPAEHFWDVFNHSMETVLAVEFLLNENEWSYNIPHLSDHIKWLYKFKRHFNKKISEGSTHRHMLKIAALLHDIGKPVTRSIDKDGRIRFIGHADKGADIADRIFERMRFSNKERIATNLLIKYHLRPFQLSYPNLPTKRAIFRYFRDSGDYGIDIMILAMADYLAARGQRIAINDWSRINKLFKYIYTEYKTQKKALENKVLINGNQIMETFNLSEGPLIGKLLLIVKEAQATGKIKDISQAIKLIEKYLLKHKLLSSTKY